MYCHVCHDLSIPKVGVNLFMIRHHVETTAAFPHLSSATRPLIEELLQVSGRWQQYLSNSGNDC